LGSYDVAVFKDHSSCFARRMKKVLILVIVCIAIALISWRFFPTHPKVVEKENESEITQSRAPASSAGGKTQTSPPQGANATSSPQTPEATAPLAGNAKTRPPASNAPALPYQLGSATAPPAMDPATVLGNTRIAIANYGTRFGGNPVGTNPEITAALNGENPQQVKFLNPESGHRINGRGELVDAWGTPFFFHQISGTVMEIRSAGPDRKMYTSDDLVTK
jgi:hypothetical protein